MTSKIVHVEHERDRISALPDLILHHIMSFLDVKEVLRTSSVSKRWISLWLSVPVLNFHIRFWIPKNTDYHSYDSYETQKKDFSAFIDRVLLNRPRNSDIQRLCIQSEYCSLNNTKNWIKFALSRNVQEIYLHYEPSSFTVEPLLDDIMAPGIKVFKFRTSPCCIPIPQSINFASHLHTLHLFGALLLTNTSSDEVEFKSPILERLIIRHCDYKGDLSISAPQIRILLVENKTEVRKSYKIKISAPKLVSLVLKGTLFKDYSLTTLDSLVNAEIELEKRVNPRVLVNILKGLYNATTIILSGQLILSGRSRRNLRLVPFLNLRTLKVLGFSKGSFENSIQNLLTSSPHIQTLQVGINQVIREKKEYAEMFKCISRLKTLEIHDIEGRENEIELIEFILKNAVVLEDFTMITTKTFWENAWDEQATFSMKNYLLPRVSSRFKILLRPIEIQSGRVRGYGEHSDDEDVVWPPSPPWAPLSPICSSSSSASSC